MSLRREEYLVWQDSEVRVDGSRASCQLRRGEAAIDTLDSVEDSKGASGERGRLTVTTLRLLWVSHANPGHNVSIGWDAMAAGRAGVAVRSAQSRLRGSLQALVVAATHGGAKFDFLFTSLVKASPRLFATAQAVHKAYETSRAYRTLRLRGAIIRPEDRAVVLLPRERVFTQLDGVWNLANDSGNLGACTVTSQRFVWRANLTENFNVSIPYLIMVRGVVARAVVCVFGGWRVAHGLGSCRLPSLPPHTPSNTLAHALDRAPSPPPHTHTLRPRSALSTTASLGPR
jgi:Bardet-Biedl syndrome 5 protein